MVDYEIGKNIKTLREKFGFSQEQLADKMEVSAQAVSKWETGDASPSIENLVKLSRLFCISVDALITDVKTYVEMDNMEKAINFKMKYIYSKYKRGEDIEESLRQVMKYFIPKIKDDVFGTAVYQTLKATLYAMLEDKNVNENNYNVGTLKDVLQFSNLDNDDKVEKVHAYFKDKSKKCKELISVCVNNARTTELNILGFVQSFVNMAIE